MSEKEKTENRLELIQRGRYLIPCSCTICKEKFKDIIIGEDHVYEKHKNREKDNVIDNLEWDIVNDNKNWTILQEIEEKRNNILRTLNDEDTLIASNIPKTFSIGKENYNLNKIVDGQENIEKNIMDKLIDKLKNRVIKFRDNILGDNYLIGEDVIKDLNKRKITKYEQDLDEILGIQKAYLILTNSGLKKKLDELEQEGDVKTGEEEEEELEDEEEDEEEEEEEEPEEE